MKQSTKCGALCGQLRGTPVEEILTAIQRPFGSFLCLLGRFQNAPRERRQPARPQLHLRKKWRRPGPRRPANAQQMNRAKPSPTKPRDETSGPLIQPKASTLRPLAIFARTGIALRRRAPLRFKLFSPPITIFNLSSPRQIPNFSSGSNALPSIPASLVPA